LTSDVTFAEFAAGDPVTVAERTGADTPAGTDAATGVAVTT
jgi:hypothetical protein